MLQLCLGNALELLTHERVQVGDHRPQHRHVLPGHLLQLLRHLFEVRVDDSLLDFLQQPLEGLFRPLVHELVPLELVDRAGGVGRQRVQLLAALGRDALEDSAGGFVAHGLEPLVDAAAFLAQHRIELLFDVLEDRVEVVALELLLTTPAQPLHHLLEPVEAIALAITPALAEQPAERRLEVPAMKDVLAETIEERVGFVAERILCPVPPAEPVPPRGDAGQRLLIHHRPRCHRARSC